MTDFATTPAALSELRERQRFADHPRWTHDDHVADELLYLQRQVRGVLDEVRSSTVADAVRQTDCIDLLDDALSQLTALTNEASERADEPRQYADAAHTLVDMAAYRRSTL